MTPRSDTKGISGNGEQAVTGEITREMPASVRRLMSLMSGRAHLDESETPTANYDQLDAILTAESEDEMWDADDRGILGGRDLAGIAMRVMRFDVKYGNRDDVSSPFVDPTGRKMYLLIDSVRISERANRQDKGPQPGELFTWNTSAPRIVGKLFWLEQNNKLPAEVLIEAIQLGGSQAVLKLKPAPRMVTAG